MSDRSAHDLRSSYDAVAHDYTARIAAELEQKPFDRLLLEQFAERVRDLGGSPTSAAAPATSPATYTIVACV